MKKFKCPLCKNVYMSKQPLYTHIGNEHKDQLPANMEPAQYYFNFVNKKDGGKCIMCRRETKWNPKTEKYERLCGRKVCTEDYREMFKRRMKRVHGKTTLLNDPEQQKKMLANRKISGTYTWRNGYKHQYVGSYEKNFLEYMENIIEWATPEGIMMPAPFVIKYIGNDKKEHFYIPDVFIPSLNLIIEVKASRQNNTHHFRQREAESEAAKDEAAEKSDYEYIKVEDNNFSQLTEFLLKDK